jgi:D-glycerate 3-kinase
VIEGWLMGCRALGPLALEAWLQSGAGLEELTTEERQWLPIWDRHLVSYGDLWSACDGLWLLHPQRWSLPRRWRFQAEARQRRAGGGWLTADKLDGLVRATVRSLPPALYQDPLLRRQPSLELQGGVILDGRRRCRPLGAQLSSLASASSAIG